MLNVNNASIIFFKTRNNCETGRYYYYYVNMLTGDCVLHCCKYDKTINTSVLVMAMFYGVNDDCDGNVDGFVDKMIVLDDRDDNDTDG